MIQTKTLVSHAKGLNFDIEPKVIINPKGNASKSVSANNWQFSKKPTSNSPVIVANVELAIDEPVII